MSNYEFNHGEAFCLMQYESLDGSEGLLVWNSRDGVTPLAMHHPDTGTLLHHVRWSEDVREVRYVPPVGSHIFTDVTEEYALAQAFKFVERWWDDSRMPMCENQFFNPNAAPSDDEVAKREAVLIYAKNAFESGSPMLAQVTEQHHEDFRVRAQQAQATLEGNQP